MSQRYGPWGGRETSAQKPSFSFFEGDFFHKFRHGKHTPQKPLLLVAFLVILYLCSGFYSIQPSQQGVVLRFGKAVRMSNPGLNWHLPWPFETVMIENVTQVKRVESGIPLVGVRAYMKSAGVDEHAMLTGDENLVEVYFTVLWVIKDLKAFLFNTRNPEDTVKSAAESVVREIVAQTPISRVLAEGRSFINKTAQEHLQTAVDRYGMGVHIQEVVMGRIDPPSRVIDAYRDVQRARADQERAINEAEAFQNALIPKKRAESTQMIRKAEGQALHVVARAREKTSPFLELLPGWTQSRRVVSDQMRLEAFADILSRQRKVVLGSSKGQTVAPILPLASANLFEQEKAKD